MKTLRGVADPRATDLLMSALDDEDSYVRSEAAYALGAQGSEDATRRLIEALDDPEVTRAAAGALGKIGDRQAVKPLLDLLEDDEIGVQAAVARSLGEIGDERAVLPLIEKATRDDTDPRVRRMSRESLRTLGYRAPGDSSRANPIILWGIGLALVAISIGLSRALGRFSVVVFLVGAALLVLYYLRERRSREGELDSTDSGDPWPPFGSGNGANGGGAGGGG